MIVSLLSCRPTLCAWYQLLHKRFFLREGCLVHISRSVRLLMMATILLTGIVGIPCTSMCTCSSATPISKNRISCFCSISKQISLKLSSTSGVRICLLYFTGNTAGGFCVHAHSSQQYITFLDSKGVKDTANN